MVGVGGRRDARNQVNREFWILDIAPGIWIVQYGGHHRAVASPDAVKGPIAPPPSGEDPGETKYSRPER